MYLNREKISKACRKRGLRLQDLLRIARVSPTAYYSLLRKESILPRSIQSLAKALDLAPSDLLEDEIAQVRKMRNTMAQCEEILQNHPSSDRGNILHTLLLLENSPEERLNRALQRGAKIHLY